MQTAIPVGDTPVSPQQCLVWAGWLSPAVTVLVLSCARGPGLFHVIHFQFHRHILESQSNAMGDSKKGFLTVWPSLWICFLGPEK